VSPTNDLIGRLRPRPDREGGFTLIEVLAAMTVFALVATAAVGMFITAMKASLVSKLDTGAKSLTQERIEVMRNLAYHIAYQPAATFNPPDFLDQYYANLTPAGTITPTTVPPGYVAASATGSSYRLPEEPATGAFYRFALNPVPGFPRYRQYVATQFLDPAGAAVTPPASYNSMLQSPADDAPSALVGITVVTKWFAGTLSKTYAVQSQMTDGQPGPSQLNGQARMTAFHIQTGVGSETQLVVEAGALSIDGSTSTGSRSAVSALGGSAALSPGSRLEGAFASVNVPPSVTPGPSVTGSSQTMTSGSELAYFAGTTVSNVYASLSNGLPLGASAASPVTSILDDVGGSSWALRVRNNAAPDSGLQIDMSKPQVYIKGGSGESAKSTGYLLTTPGTSHKVQSVLTAQTRSLHILPTSFAPEGVVQVQLQSASIDCTSTGTSPAVTGTYQAVVQYVTYDPFTATYGTTSLTVGPGMGTLTDSMLDTVQVGVDSTTGAALHLRDYISSWSNIANVPALGVQITGGKGVQMSTAGLVSLETVETRSGDESSTIAVQVGAASCVAEDNR
jgi:prepilin-type N-terminal cleavage/methylation domain-containing protein